jgi:hypothetical protein
MTGSRRLIIALLTAFVALVGTVAAAGPASAYTWRDTQGRGGFVALSKAQGVHIRQCYNAYYWSCRMAPGVHVPAQRVNRSPKTTRRQDIAVVISVQRYEYGSWTQQSTRTWYGTIPAGVRSIRMPEWTVLPNKVGYLRVNFGVVWTNKYGRNLGTRIISMNEYGDYECATNLRPCEAGAGYVFIREPGV